MFYRLKNFCQNHPQIILWTSILIYILIFSLISVWKYNNFTYNGIDLGIYNQVFWNTTQGRFFESSIQAGSYLGDHFEPLILLLLPFYLIFKNPLTLLILQTIFLALGAWAVFLIGKEVFRIPSDSPLLRGSDSTSPPLIRGGKGGSLPALLLSLVYLLNPFIQNINLFEFHILPFAIPLLLFAFYFYQTKKIIPFYIFIFLSLLVREDVALVVFMFGILALIDLPSCLRRGWGRWEIFLKWVLPPLIISILWFILAIKIIYFFNPDGNYKFLVYYSWLGRNFKEIIINFFFHPLIVLHRILNVYNLGFILGILLPFGFIPLLRPKYLILLLPPLLQNILGIGGAEGILQTHYVSLFLPSLFIASIFVLNDFFIKNFDGEKRLLIVGVLGAAVIYSFFALGPLLGSFKIIATYDTKLTKIKNYFLRQIPFDAPVLTSYEFFPNLSSRQKIYPLHYIYLGKKQFGRADYPLPLDTEYILINFDDIITFDFQFKKQSGYRIFLSTAPDRLRQILTEKNFGLVEIIDTVALFKKGYPAERNFYELNPSPYPITQKQEINLENKIKFLGFSKELIQKKIDGIDLTLLNYNFSWQALDQIPFDFQIKIKAFDPKGKLYQKYYPLAYGLYPTSKWKLRETIQTNYWFYLPRPPERLELSLVKLEGGIELNNLRETVNVVDKEEQLGQTIELNSL